MPALNDRFPACLAILFGHEGGYSNRSLKADPGGATNYGVTWKTYDAWRRSKGLATQDVRKITVAECEAIYRDWYWDAVMADKLPAGLDLAAFDFSVNSGAGTAIKYLQRTLGLPADGHLGPVTFNAIQATGNVADLIERYVDARRAFGRGLRNYYANPGWEPRWDNIERHALIMAGEAHWDVPDAPAPLPDANAQAATTGKAIEQPPKPPVGTEATLAVSGTVSNVTGFANVFGKLAALKAPSTWSIVFTFLSEPLILTGLVMTAAAVFTFLWRRKHA